MSDPLPPADDQQIILDDEPQAELNTKTQKEQHQAAKDYAKAPPETKLHMQVRIYSPFRDYFDGPAFSISAVNATGPFDILPRHHNFISLLSACEVLVRTVQGSEYKILISGGLMHVKADKVIVFLDV